MLSSLQKKNKILLIQLHSGLLHQFGDCRLKICKRNRTKISSFFSSFGSVDFSLTEGAHTQSFESIFIPPCRPCLIGQTRKFFDYLL